MKVKQMNIKCAHTQLLKTKNIQPHPKNRNKHSEKQIKVLSKIIKKNGQRSPIVISKRSGYITKGHGRLEAIKLLGWEECAVDLQDYASEEAELRDRIADNEIARYAEFDNIGFIEDLGELDLNVDDIDFKDFGIIKIELATPLNLNESSPQPQTMQEYLSNCNQTENGEPIKEKEVDENIKTNEECPNCGYKW